MMHKIVVTRRSNPEKSVRRADTQKLYFCLSARRTDFLTD